MQGNHMPSQSSISFSRWPTLGLILFLAAAFIHVAEARFSPAASQVERARGQQQVDLNEIHDDACRCSIYFLMAAQAFKNGGKFQQAQRADDAAAKLMELALELHNLETTQARLELHKRYMMSEINDNYTNFSRLIVKHNDFCGKFLEIVRQHQ
jgi:hypothetical protein